MSCRQDILERMSDVVQCKEIDKGVRNAWKKDKKLGKNPHTETIANNWNPEIFQIGQKWLQNSLTG